VVDRQEEAATGLQHAPHLGQGCRPVLQVVQHERDDDVVERAVGERQWPADVGHLQVRIRPQPLPRQPHHGLAGVEPAHDGPLRAQGCRQWSGATPCIEHPTTVDVAGERDHRWSLVVSVEEVGLVVRRVAPGEAVVVVGPHQVLAFIGLPWRERPSRGWHTHRPPARPGRWEPAHLAAV
jgi:hypothetical protein